MKINYYFVTCEVPESEDHAELRIVANDVAAVLAAVGKGFPGYSALSVSGGLPVDAITKSALEGRANYYYSTTFTESGSDAKKILRIVAPDVVSVLAEVNARFPGSSLLNAPGGMVVDAIADGIE
jgi:hypothetical protein